MRGHAEFGVQMPAYAMAQVRGLLQNLRRDPIEPPSTGKGVSMLRRTRRLAASSLLAAMLTAFASPALAGEYYKYYEYDDDPSGVAPDALFMRPLGLVGFFLGLGLFFPAAVMTTVVGQPQNIDKPFETLVLEPGKWTFVEPIGTH